MAWWRSLLLVSLILILAATATLLWQKRSAGTTPAAGAAQSDTITMTDLYAGGKPAKTLPDAKTPIHEEISSYDVAEGKRLYHWFNCNTCHANGGGDIGPALMDEKWLYGSEPRNIFSSIVEGRPNGMPSFRGKIPDQQVWQLVAYVRSMSSQVPLYAKPGRDDDLQAKPPESMAPESPPVPGGNPAADARSRTH
jgi:cytochrome c oxidase cbb3-type subunit 3